MSGHVRKRTTASGAVRWQARVHTPQGERVRTFDRKGQAQAWIADQSAALSRGEWVDPQAGQLRFDVWAERWHASLTGLRPATVNLRRWLLDKYVLPHFASMPLVAIDKMAVRTWVRALSDRGLSPETVRKAHGTLLQVLEAAVEDRLVPRNAASGVKLPTIERAEIRVISPEEIDTLAGEIDPRYRALVYVGCYGGLRIGELAGLQVSHVDGRTLRVRQAVAETKGHTTIGPLKTKAAQRDVTLPQFVADHLAAHMSALPSGDPLVFPAPYGGMLGVSRFRSRTWKPAIDRVGLEGFRIHDMRHTAVSLWIAAGANPKVVAQRAGHTSVSVVIDRYGHLYPGEDTALADRLDVLYGPADGGRSQDGHGGSLEAVK